LFCRVITPEEVVFDDEVDMVVARIADGELGVLVDHAPLVSTVEPGAVRISHGDERHIYATSDGFFKVSENLVQVLVEEATSPRPRAGWRRPSASFPISRKTTRGRIGPAPPWNAAAVWGRTWCTWRGVTARVSEAPDRGKHPPGP
jgi:hypothetical protein